MGSRFAARATCENPCTDRLFPRKPRRTAPMAVGPSVSRQVFGLVGISGGCAGVPGSRRFPGPSRPSAFDDLRSHSPLRGSSGFEPDSLLPRVDVMDGAQHEPVSAEGWASRGRRGQGASRFADSQGRIRALFPFDASGLLHICAESLGTLQFIVDPTSIVSEAAESSSQ
jgi:hypothetical protein